MSVEPPTNEPATTEDTERDSMPEGNEDAPRGVAIMRVLRWVLIAAAALLAMGAWRSFAMVHRSEGAAAHAALYHCPMHPQIVSDVPGECPICHMTLEPIPAAHGRPPSGAPSSSTMLLSGTVPLEITPERAHAIGVRTSRVTEENDAGALRVTATVAAPEQGVSEAHVRAAGYVERVYVGQTGVLVAKGQPLLAMYSPELYQAQSELLTARSFAGSSEGAPAFEAARRKVELLGMSSADIARVLEKNEPLRAVAVVAPAGGYVTKKNVVLGSYVTPEMVLYELQDLARLYVIADVFPQDAPSIRVGSVGRFTPTSRPDSAITGKIDLVYPVVNADARTTRVRMQVKNTADTPLRPGDYGSLEIASAAHHELLVPRDALVDTGHATYVFVVEADGRYVPRVVAAGGARGDAVVVTAGLHAGEMVVSGATFLLAAESGLEAEAARAAGGAP